MEFKRMSDVTNHYIVRAKHEAEAQYESLRPALTKTMQRQGWMVQQVSFVAGARSLNEQELKKNLEYFKVPSARVEPIRTKLDMKIFDEYANTTGTLQTDQLWDPRLLLLTLSHDSLTKLGSARREGTSRGYN